MDFLMIGIALMLVWLGAKIVEWISLRAGIISLAIAGIIFLMGAMG